MDLIDRDGSRAILGAGERRLVELEERRGAARDPDAADLFHFALRLPSRPALARQLARLMATDTRLTGASDHNVSEALYLRDPDGHGIELYRDRPRDAWYRDGRVQMGTTALNLEKLLEDAPATGRGDNGLHPDSVIGHVHLETVDLQRAKAFYVDRLGLDVTTERPGAIFMSKGGYHHHVAVNTWGRRTRPARDDRERIGMLWFEIQLPDRQDLAAVADALGADVTADQTLVVADPNGLAIRFVTPA
jgi:catechol 2,3-dioxygenase